MTPIAWAILFAILLTAFAIKVGFDLGWLWFIVITAFLAALLLAVYLIIVGSAVRQHLVDDVGTIWKRWSTQLAGFQFASAIAAWAALPDEWRASIAAQPNLLFAGVAALGAAFVLAQMVKQKNLTPPQ